MQQRSAHGQLLGVRDAKCFASMSPCTGGGRRGRMCSRCRRDVADEENTTRQWARRTRCCSNAQMDMCMRPSSSFDPSASVLSNERREEVSQRDHARCLAQRTHAMTIAARQWQLHACLTLRSLLSTRQPRRACAMAALPVSRRIRATDDPVIVATKAMIAAAPRDVLSLAQGIVHWAPPDQAVRDALAAMADPATRVHQYGPDEGLPQLREALRRKVEAENGLPGHEVMVTAGANQAFANVVLGLVDESDRVVLFRPYYFNHLMCLQMTGGAERVVFGKRDPVTMHPDLDWLASVLSGPSPPRMVVICNPCNPTGTLLSEEECQRAAELCQRAGAWLVMDNTYEHFAFADDAGTPRRHMCKAAPHVIHLFSFSKAFGMMGWRVGYIAYPKENPDLSSAFLKVQDTVPICPTQLSQVVALGAVHAGRAWVQERVEGLTEQKAAVMRALQPLGKWGEGVFGGEGAIYVFAKLPEGCEDDAAVAKWLVDVHGVCVIPGSACGAPGHIRVAYANLPREMCLEAAARLHKGLRELADKGAAAMDAGS